MPLPASWKTVTVTATYLLPSGVAAAGSVQFTAVRAVGMDETVVLPAPITATLNGSGQISVSLPCPDDVAAGFTSLQYEVKERVQYARESFHIQIDNSMTTASVADLRIQVTNDQLEWYVSAPGSAAAAAASAAAAAAHAADAFDSATSALAAQLAVEQAAVDAQQIAAALVNYIGIPGQQGFGVGICPEPPPGFAPMEGTYSKAAQNYGNYTYTDGSVMVWIPAFYYRIGHASSPRYAVHAGNAIDIIPITGFIDVAAANAAGYALHRMFYDNGTIQRGVFVDKYQCSNNAGTASSIRLAPPLSSNSAHNPFSGLTGAPANAYYGAFDAAKTRGAQFFPAMRYIHAGIALLAQAHAQASTSTTYCAWWSSGATNFPKGNNNNALKDGNDTGVTFTSDGYSGGNSALTGSGVPFEKTTHNGQSSGVADLNGNMYEISPGLTCFTTSKGITGASKANPVQVTAVGHGFTSGDVIQITGVVGMTELNNRMFKITVTGADTFTLDGVDGSAFTVYTSGGTATKGDYYALNTSSKASALTGGTTLTTDQWSTSGVAAHSSPIALQFATTYPNNTYAQRYGNGANQVLPSAASGNDWLRTGMGLAQADGVSSAGTTAFGQDYHYQSHANLLCPRAAGYWNDTSNAGVWAVLFNNVRSSSYALVGFRAACYP